MVREVLLIDFRIISVGCGPRQIACIAYVQNVAKLIEKVDRDVAPNTGRNRSFTPAELKVRRGPRQHGNVDDNLLAARWMRHGDGVVASGVWEERGAEHAAV